MAAYQKKTLLWIAALLLLVGIFAFVAIDLRHREYMARFPQPLQLSSGWQLQDAAKVAQSGGDLSQTGMSLAGWHDAVVPGTVLTSLGADRTYPEPLYGENNRPDIIPDTLCRTDWWYRTEFRVPPEFEGRRVWLNFAGINYSAEVWVNGKLVGGIQGAFIRGLFDVTGIVKPGHEAAVAVRISPQPHPGNPIEHTVKNGLGRNGGITAIDGPTFLCTIGWDWIPGIRDRDSGIWRGVTLSASGPVTIDDPAVTTDLPLPRLDTADVAIRATLSNHTGEAQRGILKGEILGENGAPFSFQRAVDIPANGATDLSFQPRDTPQLLLDHPSLWWPNGYGLQNLYRLRLTFTAADGYDSDRREVSFGIRKITYSVPNSKNLTISVNGVPVFCRGGDWGMDEALKRIPYERLDAQIRMHQIAHLNMIRNWVGQSTSEDFYDLCDRYGIMLWDEFFQPNPSDGPNPTDLATYLANARDKVLRFRNHPSIAVWCGRNEGPPPPKIDAALTKLMAELDPDRRYQSSSADGGGVRSGGPYFWRPPEAFYNINGAFKTEIGSVSIPTLESIQGMMPQKDWEVINDDWAEHDLARGAQHGDTYPGTLRSRYGDLANLADFARKGQLANYETFRAMYEGRNASLFNPCTGVITWMSNPAQPSFVWQLYHHDLEANASLYAIHIQMNEQKETIEVINNLPTALSGAVARLRIFNLDGTQVQDDSIPVTAAASLATTVGPVEWPTTISPVHFVDLELTGSGGVPISNNFYWHAAPTQKDFLPLESLPPVNLDITATAHETGTSCVLNVTVHNPTTHIALMTHLQLRRAQSGTRALPAFYSDNYLSLIPGETRTLTIEAPQSAFAGEAPLIAVDGWNVTVTDTSAASGEGVAIALNKNAQVNQWPRTGLPSPPVPFAVISHLRQAFAFLP
jgi:hypothetical protein